jgi:hypothetical protein
MFPLPEAFFIGGTEVVKYFNLIQIFYKKPQVAVL